MQQRRTKNTVEKGKALCHVVTCYTRLFQISDYRLSENWSLEHLTATAKHPQPTPPDLQLTTYNL